MVYEKRIPKEKIKEGIGISLEKSAKHLDGAKALIDRNLLDDAVALIEFAIEDFGRAVYLRERLQMGLETIEKALEKDHLLKYNEAFSVLPTDLKAIWENTISYFPRGWFPENYFPKGWYGIREETISPTARLNAVFPCFDEKTQTWQSGIKVDRKKLTHLIEAVKEKIKTFSY